MLLLLNSTVGYSQDDPKLDAPLGLRVKRNGLDYLIYADKNLEPNLQDYRKLNHRVYFRKVNIPIKVVNGVKYQLITIPGKAMDKVDLQPTRSGKIVGEEDYDKNFWIEEGNIGDNLDVERFKYANDVFSGLLTAPFKYRLSAGENADEIIDGDFNVAPFLGWKWRISSVNPFYIAPFIFTGITTLNYNSANNTLIMDADKAEVGAGLTYGLGISLKFGNVSPGFVLGWDHGVGNLGNGFVYKDKPWISFSLNYDFFKPSPTSSKQ